jgi:hypothetical protein
VGQPGEPRAARRPGLIHDTGGGASPKVRLHRGQCKSPEGRPTELRSFSSVVRQMGQTRSNIVSEAMAAAEADAAAPPAPGGSCTDCCAAA